MIYEVEIGTEKTIVDAVKFTMSGGSQEGNADLHLEIIDKEQDIFEKKVWIDWINSYLSADNPDKRVKDIKVTIKDGDTTHRTITMKKAFISSFVEGSSHTGDQDSSYCKHFKYAGCSKRSICLYRNYNCRVLQGYGLCSSTHG